MKVTDIKNFIISCLSINKKLELKQNSCPPSELNIVEEQQQCKNKMHLYVILIDFQFVIVRRKTRSLTTDDNWTKKWDQ